MDDKVVNSFQYRTRASSSRAEHCDLRAKGKRHHRAEHCHAECFTKPTRRADEYFRTVVCPPVFCLDCAFVDVPLLTIDATARRCDKSVVKANLVCAALIWTIVDHRQEFVDAFQAIVAYKLFMCVIDTLCLFGLLRMEP